MIGRLPTTGFALVRSQKRWRELLPVDYLVQPQQEVVLPPSVARGSPQVDRSVFVWKRPIVFPRLDDAPF